MDPNAPSYVVELNRHLVLAVGISSAALAIVMLVATTLAARNIIRSNQYLARRYEALREETLREFLSHQREENARLVADTRAATAKMNTMAEALWDGLQPAVRQIARDHERDH